MTASSSLVYTKEEDDALDRFLKDNNFDYDVEVEGNETDVRKVPEDEDEVPSYFPKKGRRKRKVQAPLLILRLTQEADPEPTFQTQLARSLFRRDRDDDDDEEQKPRTKRKSENF
jgi:hypothetical protein